MPPEKPEGSTAVAPAADSAPDTSPDQTSETPDTSGSDGDGSTPTPKADAGPVVTKGGLKLTIQKPKSRFQERISTLVGQRDQRDEENRVLRQQLAALQDAGGKPAAPGNATKPAGHRGDGLTTKTDLNPEDFETYGDYVQAIVERTIENAAQKQRGESGERAVARHRDERRELFEQAAAPLIEAHGDAFFEAITDPNLPVSDAMAEAVLELDDIGPFVMLYLSNNPRESLKMAKMNPRAATVAIGRLSAKLDYEIRQGGQGQPAADQATGDGAEPTPPPAPVRPAPSTVPTPRGGSPADLGGLPNDKMDTKNWMIAEANRLRNKYGANTRSWIPK